MSYYEILGLIKTASPDEIKKAYKKIAFQKHPDRHIDNKEQFEKEFKEINMAYETLSNPEKRKNYDMTFSKYNLFDFISFGQSTTKIYKTQFNDIQIPIGLTLETIYSGKNITIRVERFSLCDYCNQTGAKDRINRNCDMCDGMGSLQQEMKIGPIHQTMKIVCPKCNGSKYQESFEKCEKCQGEKIYKEKYKTTLKIPKGIQSGQVIILKNEGHIYDMKTEDRKDLYFIINEYNDKPDDKYSFKRKNDDLYLLVPIRLEECICGFEKNIFHLDGRTILMKSEGFHSFDEKITIIGEGMNEKGNLIISFEILFPKKVKCKKQFWELLSENQ